MSIPPANAIFEFIPGRSAEISDRRIKVQLKAELVDPTDAASYQAAAEVTPVTSITVTINTGETITGVPISVSRSGIPGIAQENVTITLSLPFPNFEFIGNATAELGSRRTTAVLKASNVPSSTAAAFLAAVDSASLGTTGITTNNGQTFTGVPIAATRTGKPGQLEEDVTVTLAIPFSTFEFVGGADIQSQIVIAQSIGGVADRTFQMVGPRITYKVKGTNVDSGTANNYQATASAYPTSNASVTLNTGETINGLLVAMSRSTKTGQAGEEVSLTLVVPFGG